MKKKKKVVSKAKAKSTPKLDSKSVSIPNPKAESKAKKPNASLLVQLAQQKAEAQKAGKNSKNFDKFQSSKFGQGKKPLLGPARGGRNGQGKP